MGGWIALHVALLRPERVAALVGIAAAPDFTEWGFTAAQKAELLAAGRLEEPNPYGPEPSLVTLPFWESGQRPAPARPRDRDRLPRPPGPRRPDEDVPLDVAFRTDARAPFSAMSS